MSDGKRLNRSFIKTLLDSPVPNNKIKFFPSAKKLGSKLINILPEPLKLTKYVAPKPKPKPRTQKSRPVPLPRSIPKPIDEKVQKFIDEITSLYKPEAISAFQKNFKGLQITERNSKRKGQSFKKQCQII